MKVKQNDEEYNKYVEAVTPKHSCFKNCLNAFWIGGLICLLGQAINNFMSSYFSFNKEDAGSYTSLILVLISVLLTSFNLYKKIAKYGGAGALVPITGFANSVASPTIEYQKEGEVFGKGVKVFTIAGPVILFGIITSFIVGFIYWVIKTTGII
ncbi:MAG: stage V sporulation protein AC [Clostridium sp.]|nr:stage V sporulation protein AC [Clostridium sp.]MCM1399271.1 stage V sporulation protein AC [Clostridium sp.]MCM1459759.1 stage V sporulation protein AC [Bacteroides sp.]